MNKLKLKVGIYPYGKSWDTLKNKLDESKKDWVTIYTNPNAFKNVPLSSLEGYFILFGDDKYKLDNGLTEDFSTAFPRFTLKRENMSSFERKVIGEFMRLYGE